MASGWFVLQALTGQHSGRPRLHESSQTERVIAAVGGDEVTRHGAGKVDEKHADDGVLNERGGARRAPRLRGPDAAVLPRCQWRVRGLVLGP